MTESEFTQLSGGIFRHLLTLGSGLLIAHGLTSSGDTILNLAPGLAVFAATVTWSFIQKHKLLTALCAGANLSAIESLLQQAITFKKQDADPLLITHMIGTALSIAQQEMLAVYPQLAPNVAVATPAGVTPAPAPVPDSSSVDLPVEQPQGLQEPDLNQGVTNL